MGLDEAINILEGICPTALARIALEKIRKDIIEKSKKINELENINLFLEECLSGTVQVEK